MKFGAAMKKTSEIFLLDTHILIWLTENDDRISNSKILPTILKAEKSNSLRVSVITAWEIGLLEKKGKRIFLPDSLSWIKEVVNSENGISFAPLTPEIAVLSCNFSKDFHNDPADRIILATSISNDYTLITKDQKILEYARKNKLNVIEP